MPATSADEHHRLAAEHGPVPIALVTVSDTRTIDSDPNGEYLRREAEHAGHRVVGYDVVTDDAEGVGSLIDRVIASGEARIILLNGGTGISRRDNTHDVVAARLDKVIPGFGELFRMLSFEQVGAGAMMSRAVAGVSEGVVIISVPGSPDAVRLAWERLIAPELEHLAWEVGR